MPIDFKRYLDVGIYKIINPAGKYVKTAGGYVWRFL